LYASRGERKGRRHALAERATVSAKLTAKANSVPMSGVLNYQRDKRRSRCMPANAVKDNDTLDVAQA
jgi:hypothetical protein